MTAALTLETAKQFLRYEADDTDQDDVISIAMAAGQEWVERYTGLLLTQREVTQAFPRFCGALGLLYGPVEADSSTINYVGSDGTATTVDSRMIITDGEGRATLWPLSGAQWPIADETGLSITYTAGYADPDTIPAGLLHAMLVYAGAFDDLRNGEDMTAAMAACHALVAPYRAAML